MSELPESSQVNEEGQRRKISGILQAAEYILDSYANEPNPIIKHRLFLDKFQILVLAGLGFVEQSGPKFTPEQKAQMQRISEALQLELKELSDWVSRPSVEIEQTAHE